MRSTLRMMMILIVQLNPLLLPRLRMVGLMLGMKVVMMIMMKMPQLWCLAVKMWAVFLNVRLGLQRKISLFLVFSYKFDQQT